MKVKIFTEGGKNIGLGHISRCTSLYNEVSKRKIKVDFIINGDLRDVDLLNGINFINENWIDEKYLINNILADDYVIIDSYKAEKVIYDVIAELSKKALFIDDIGRLDYPKGIIVNPALDASYIDYSQSPNSILLSGPEYVILRLPFIGVERENLFKRIKRVLITMGGTDIRELTPFIVNTVCKKRLDIEFDIVIGSKWLEDQYNPICGSGNISTHANINATQMMHLMVSSDLAITAAGQTIYELLATQTPFIPIQIIENQENNIRSLLKYNPEQIVLKYDDEDLGDSILEALKINNTGTYRQEQNMKYRELVDGYGSKRIFDKLLEDM
jgi:UDP-2,4-diacetamido-2,4,6-trideoxy-beta-L-altropyranose hydrolase